MPFKDEVAFRNWCHHNGYDAQTIALIERIRSSPPSRNVTGGRGNVRARIPSHKMGVTIQSESRTAEKPGMRVFYEYDHLLEHQTEAEVIEYYDQPDKISLKYLSSAGRSLTVWHTPDFFVIRADGAGWEEWKTAAELEGLAEKQPNRYQRDEQGTWHSPPGEAYARRFGLCYRLRSNAEIDWNVFSNLEFLHEYLASSHLTAEPSVKDWLVTQVKAQPGMTLAQLLQTELTSADDVYRLISQRHLYVNLSHARLVEPERVQVFASFAAAESHQHLLTPTQASQDGQGMQPQPGAQPSVPAEVEAIWRSAREEDYAIANARLQVLKALEEGLSVEEVWALEGVETVLGEQRTLRAIRSWRRQFAEAELRWGNGYVGLIPRHAQRGNYQRKLAEETLAKMDVFIETRYEDLRQSSVTSVWIEYCHACEAEGITPASRMTFGIAVKNRPQDTQVRKREGKRAAHQAAKRYWYLEATTPRHGERAWHIVHLDHTQLDASSLAYW